MGSKLIAAGLTFDTAAPPSQGEEPKPRCSLTLRHGWNRKPAFSLTFRRGGSRKPACSLPCEGEGWGGVLMTTRNLVLPAEPPPRLPLRRGRSQNCVAASHFAMSGARHGPVATFSIPAETSLRRGEGENKTCQSHAILEYTSFLNFILSYVAQITS
ncbi:hypothetical protein EDF78_12151 [Rahnella sp. BIGb0236]|nr:hypothetical protein EDF78_12151 [Rahnella sp. BIGb0236]